MPLIYITARRFAWQFNENGVGPRQFKPTRDVFNTINRKQALLLHIAIIITFTAKSSYTGM